MMQYTNNYTILKDILKNEYILVLSLLFNNFDDIIHLLKNKMPLQGEILEYLYLSQPLYYNNIHDNICTNFSYIDNMVRTLYKNIKKKDIVKFKKEVHGICELFHLEDSEFEYYYFIALAIIGLESSINKEANELYNQLDLNIRDMIDNYIEEFLNLLNKQEFQCLFYNHLEDVYESNISIDKKISVLYKNNYSFFLDNLNKDTIFQKYLLPIENKRYPLIITNQFIFCIVNNKPCVLEDNHIEGNIFDDSIRYIASYYLDDMSIRNWIPFFNFFHKYNDNITTDLLDYFYNIYQVQYPLYDNSIKTLSHSSSFIFYDSDIVNNVHYYISNFTVYSLDILESNNTNTNEEKESE